MIRIPISLLSSFFYCPYKAYLEYHGFPGEETPQMKEGRKWHEKLEKEHLERSNLTISIKEAFKYSTENNAVVIFREVPVEEDILYGRIDELWIAPQSIVILDDKPKVSFGYKLQVIGYAYTFLRSFSPDRPIVLGIRKRENKQFLWYEVYEKKHNAILQKYLRKVISTVRGELDSWKIDPRKCAKCKFRNVCPFRKGGRNYT